MGFTILHSVPDGTPNRQRHHFDTAVSMTVLAVMFTCLRFYARVQRGIGLGWDDYVLAVGVVFLLGCLVCQMFMLHYGMGLHAEFLEPWQVSQMMKTLLAYEIVYSTTVGIIKVSLLLMYIRIFTIPAFRKVAWTLMCIAVSWAIAINFASAFQCTPVKKAWLPQTPGTCIHVKAFFFGNAIPNIITDLVMLCLPMPVVWTLHSSLGHKLSLSVVFSLGAFTIFASTYRFTTLFQFDPLDPSWTLADSTTWSLIEGAAGIISACLPTLRPLLKKFTTLFPSSTAASSNPSAPNPPTIGSSPLKPFAKRGLLNSLFSRIDEKTTMAASVLDTRKEGEAEAEAVWCKGDGSEDGKSDLEMGNIEERPLRGIRVETDTEIVWTGPRGAGRAM
ncbi:hypothetical protein EX30DRAFT_305028 [Ascodesmis nigricans]|uniref:Rhodopsin domain-containing protein n=1 Tax=Ascodesmis nigricans TaxID=341454 RepID=A0A4S2N0K5_9PEZI|nr:hypothetical protein EX30DRAFT_305028 [Ascodesmis nigricans]